MPLHRNSDVTNNHIIQSLSYADATARTSAVLVAADIGRIARQLDNDTFWILTDDSPLTWVQLASGTPPPSPGGAPVNVTKATADAGVSNDYSRQDHKHDIDTAIVVSLSPNSINTEGTSTSLARADHTHQVPTGAAVSVAPDNTNTAGTAVTFARSDHGHALPTAAPSSLSVGGSNVAGTANSVCRSDHTHALPAFGSSAGTFCEGNDARLSDARPPTGAAGGQLGGTYPNPDVRGLRETSGPTLLTAAAISDGQYLARSGTDIAGVTPPVFGTHFQYAESLGDSTTTSDVYQTKVLLTTSSLPAGTYVLFWSYVWAYNSTTTDFHAQVLEDGANQLQHHAQEPQDPDITTQRQPVGGHAVRTLASGVHTFAIQYRSETGGATSLITSARLTLWRVA